MSGSVLSSEIREALNISNPKKTLQVSCPSPIANYLQAEGVRFNRVDPFIKKEITDFIDTMEKQKIVFLDIDKKNWEKAVILLKQKGVNKMMICTEKYELFMSLNEYLFALTNQNGLGPMPQ